MCPPLQDCKNINGLSFCFEQDLVKHSSCMKLMCRCDCFQNKFTDTQSAGRFLKEDSRSRNINLNLTSHMSVGKLGNTFKEELSELQMFQQTVCFCLIRKLQMEFLMDASCWTLVLYQLSDQLSPRVAPASKPAHTPASAPDTSGKMYEIWRWLEMP